MNRAYARLETKALEEIEDAYIIKGTASTPRTDRMGDVVAPMGARFEALPKLFLHHDTKLPIGNVSKVKPTINGIPFEARIPKVSEPGIVKDRIDEAVHSIKYDLLSYVSIGFMPIESEPIDAKNPYYGGTHFKEWDWYELSVVGVPANPEAVITGIKSIDDELHAARVKQIKSADQAQLAASGDRLGRVVRLASLPGASGKPIATIPKDTKMKQTVAEQIASFEAKRAASAARMSEIMEKSAEAGSTLDETQTQEYDGLAVEVKAVDDHLVRLKAHEAQIVSRAAPVSPRVVADGPVSVDRAPSGILFAGPKLEPGIRFARMAIALHRARGDRSEALAQVQANKRWMDQTPEIATVLKAAVPAADTLTSGWASELVYANNIASEFIEYLRPLTILGQLTGVRRVPFNVRMGSLTGGTTGYWVGQGKAIPMSKGTTGSLSLGMTKAAGMSAYDDEILKSSSPSIEEMVRNDLGKAVAQTIDVAFIDPNNGGIANEKPASILYNVTPTSASGTNAAAVSTDVTAAFAAAIAANLDPMSGVWVMTPTTALRLSMMQTSLGQKQYPDITIKGGSWQGLPVIVSANAAITGSPQFGSMIVLILQNEIILADDGDVNVEISNEASIEMLDNPTNLSTGATAPTTVVSMFQTQSWAIKAVRYINWTKRRAASAAFIQAALYA